MTTDAKRRHWRDAVDDALNASERADRYQQRQREIRRGRGRANDGPRPLEFDESGFPIPQPIPGFMQRIGRLIHG
ncbi:MAG TPA: hypothetical protein VHG69_02920 [Thermoleophilaceae bacterium]|nr:hypothetical protein [Thermoleophilaceae bacterium]